MVGFSDVMNQDDVAAIQQYVIQQAHRIKR
jgi:hypothetical protein